MQNLKIILIRQLIKEKVFWSYENPESKMISDELLVEKVIVHLDMKEINMLFKLYDKNFILKAWKSGLPAMEPEYHSLNRMIAMVYFDIKHPDRFIKYYVNKNSIN